MADTQVFVSFGWTDLGIRHSTCILPESHQADATQYTTATTLNTSSRSCTLTKTTRNAIERNVTTEGFNPRASKATVNGQSAAVARRRSVKARRRRPEEDQDDWSSEERLAAGGDPAGDPFPHLEPELFQLLRHRRDHNLEIELAPLPVHEEK